MFSTVFCLYIIAAVSRIALSENFFKPAFLTKPPNKSFGARFSLFSRRSEKTVFFPFLHPSPGVVFVEWWMVLLQFLMVDGSSLSQSVLPISHRGFIIKLCFLLLTRCALEDRYQKIWCSDVIFWVSRKFQNYSYKFFSPRSLSNLTSFCFEDGRLNKNHLFCSAVFKVQ